MKLPSFLQHAPTKILCIELNYKDHAHKLGLPLPKKPVFFYKPVETIIGPEEEIVIPKNCFSVDHQAALAVIIGKKMHHITPSEAKKAIAGFTCANDITEREAQGVREQFYRMKSYPTFTPLGPKLVPCLPTCNLNIQCYVNGKLRQHSTTENFIFTVEELLCSLARDLVLYPGDIVLTGTPYGIGPLFEGDRVEVTIEGIGTLRNPVAKSTVTFDIV